MSNKIIEVPAVNLIPRPGVTIEPANPDYVRTIKVVLSCVREQTRVRRAKVIAFPKQEDSAVQKNHEQKRGKVIMKKKREIPVDALISSLIEAGATADQYRLNPEQTKKVLGWLREHPDQVVPLAIEYIEQKLFRELDEADLKTAQ